jgi:hypothetical protein
MVRHGTGDAFKVGDVVAHCALFSDLI